MLKLSSMLPYVSKTARLQARAWFDPVQQAEMAVNHARAQRNSCGFEGVDISVMDVSMHTEKDNSTKIDMDVSMRTTAPYSPPPPLPLRTASLTTSSLKSDISFLSFDSPLAHPSWRFRSRRYRRRTRSSSIT